jgi:hypothetical protein
LLRGFASWTLKCIPLPTVVTIPRHLPPQSSQRAGNHIAMTSADIAAKLAAFKINKDAMERDYVLRPHVEYRTVAAVNGPLVILDKVKNPRFSEIVDIV